MFCKKCGGLLIPTIVDGKKVLKCSKCGAIYGINNFVVSKEIKSKREEVEYKIDEWTFAKNVKCPKCGNQGVYYQVKQTRAADEAPTIIYRCPKCGYTWREYG